MINTMTKLSWRRIKKGNGFTFITKTGKSIPKQAIDRIKKLAIPPAWIDVTVSKYKRNNIQAVGIDAKGRKQYIYNPNWVKKNQEQKFDQMIMFGERLPTLREAVRSHMKEHSLTQDRVIATVIWLLEHTFIRVGNDKYAKENESYGLTTMREKHLKLRGNTITFNFKGKSGVFHELDVTNESVAKTIRECIELPGYEIFQYLDEDGNKRVVDSTDVNNYIEVHTGKDFSAKDFRTWGGSVLAGHSLYKKGTANSKDDMKNNITDVVEIVSTHLGNTKKVCRTYYIHPAIITSYEKDILVPHFKMVFSRKSAKKLSLTPVEYATWSLIKDS
jgi:DNA topoisomerase I